VFTVVYDANVLYSAPLRDFLVRLARTRRFHGRWTDAILDETFRSIIANRPDLDEGKLGSPDPGVGGLGGSDTFRPSLTG
jgi:hypothetical protein